MNSIGMKKRIYSIISLALLLCGCGAKASAAYLSGNENSGVSEGQDADNMGDLVYYGEPAVFRNEGDIIVIDLNAFDGFEHIAGVYVRNCSNDHEDSLPISREIRHTVEEDGSYYVDAILDSGEIVDLRDYICVEHSYTNGTGDTGIIDL